jgi:molybdopterin-guanine dinucleotide biosynthesis protein
LEITMELIYTAQASGFEPGKRYRNPQHFDRPEPGVKAVVIVGEWPKVAAAYEEAGAEVSVVEAPKRVAIVEGPDQAELDRLIAELASIGMIVESFAEQSLERPQGELGETAGRLFQVLEAVNAGIASLQRERDGEAEKARLLQKQVDDLLAQAAKRELETEEAREANEVAELKAKLDAANVTYRANASKESLQKQVAELGQQ